MSTRRFGYPIGEVLMKMYSDKDLSDLYQETQQVSDKYSADWDARKRIRRASQTDDDWRKVCSAEYEEWHKDTTERNKIRLHYYGQCIEKTKRSEQAGKITKEAAKAIFADADDKIANINREDAVLRSNRNGLEGSSLDAYKASKVADLAFVEMLISSYELPHGHSRKVTCQRSKSAHSPIRKRLIKYYQPGQAGQGFWCPISRSTHLSEHVRAAHLVPHSTMEPVCEHLFGEAESGKEGHLMSEGNGLMLERTVEQALNQGRIIIVPAVKGDIDPETQTAVDFNADPEPYKVKVLDKGFLGPNANIDCLVLVKT